MTRASAIRGCAWWLVWLVTFLRPLVVAGAPTVIEASVPARMCPSEGRHVGLVLENAGEAAWDPAAGDRIAYHWRAEDGSIVVFDGRRTALPRVTNPGQRVELEAVLLAPSTSGVYRLEWAIVREHVRWSLATGGEDTRVQVAGAEAFAWELGEAKVEGVAAAAATTVPVKLRNTGCAAWSGELGDALAYHWYDAAGRLVVAEGVRSPLPSVAPGETVEVAATVVGPPQPGAHRLRFEPLREGISWFGEADGSPADARIEVGKGPLGWSIVHAEDVASVAARSRSRVALVIRNEGSERWSAAAGDRLSYRWLDPQGRRDPIEGVRTELPNVVEPGSTAAVAMELLAPPEPGHYRLAIEMVREHVSWFGPATASPWAGNAGPEIEVGPSRLAWAVVEIEPRATMWAGRINAFEVRLRNVGVDSWSSETADHLSYRVFDSSGELVVAEGVRTEFPKTVAAGDEVSVSVSVLAPAVGDTFVVEFQPVREHVAWFGPPREGVAGLSLKTRWLSRWLAAALTIALGIAGFVARRYRRSTAGFDAVAWPLWVMAAYAFYSQVFVDLSGIDLWPGATFVSVGSAALVAFVVVAVPKRWMGPVALVVVGFGAVLTIADLAYIEFFDSLLPISGVVAVHHLVDASGTVASLIRPAHAAVLVVPASGVVLLVCLRRPTERAARRGWPTRIGTATGLLAIALPAIVALSHATLGRLGDRVFSEAHNAGRLGVIGAHWFQLGRALRGFGGPGAVTDEQWRRAVAFYRARAADRHRGSQFGVAKGMNAVLIQVEALQGWAVGAHIGGVPVMPFLNEAARGGAAYFPGVFDQTGQGRTSDAEYLALASNHPLGEGALSFLRAENEFVTIAHALRDRGYSTLSAHPYRPGFWNRSLLHPRYGFERSLFMGDFEAGPLVGWGLGDAPFLEQMARRLAVQQQPFFAFLVTLSLHHPYDSFPTPLQEIDIGSLQDTKLGNYLHAMHYFDLALRQFFADLETHGLRGNTVVVVYGDHTAGLGHGANIVALARFDPADPIVATRLATVPLFVWTPAGQLAGRFDRIGGQVDIAPTLLDVLGVASPGSFAGLPLWKRGGGVAALHNGGVVTPEAVLVRAGVSDPSGACHDYAEGRRRPREACDAAAEAAGQQLEVSRWVLDYDLYSDL